MLHKDHFIFYQIAEKLMCAARQLGYRQKSEHWDMQYDFANELDYPLPKGFHFVNRQNMDMEKVSKCCFKGFDHEQSEGPWNHQYDQNNYQLSTARNAAAGRGYCR